MNRHLRAWFAVFVVAVFMAGLGGGMLLDRYVAPPRHAPGPMFGVPGEMAFGRGRGAGQPLRHVLTADLNLTAEQQKQLDQIFANRQRRIEEVRGEVRARFAEEQRGMRDEIEKILTPDQRKKFEDWLSREPLPGVRGGFPGMGRGRGMGRGAGRGPGGGL